MPAADTPVTLPQVKVTEPYRGKVEPWRYAKVGSFEILSQADGATVTQLAQTLELIPVIVKTIWPAPVSIEQEPATIILCNNDNTFQGFIPSEVTKAVRPIWVDRLFFKENRLEAIVLNCDKAGNPGRFKEIVRDYARRSLLALKQPPPDWFVTGMAEIIADADYTLTDSRVNLHYANLDRVVVRAAQAGFEPSLYETEKPSPAVREIIRGALNNRSAYESMADDSAALSYQVSHERFNQYFTRNHYHPRFEDVLRNNPSLNPDDYRMTCWAFVHLCAFAQKRGYSRPLQDFLRLIAKNPEGDLDALFRKAFNESPERMGMTVIDYATTISSQGTTKEIERPSSPSFAIVEATADQVGRLKGDAYRMGGHLQEATAEITKARFFDSLESPQKR